jgi:hypothetical protein
VERDTRIELMECLQPANDLRSQTIVSHQDVAETQNLCCWDKDSFIRVGDVVRAAAVQKEIPTSFGDVCEASGSTWFMGGESPERRCPDFRGKTAAALVSRLMFPSESWPKPMAYKLRQRCIMTVTTTYHFSGDPRPSPSTDPDLGKSSS